MAFSFSVIRPALKSSLISERAFARGVQGLKICASLLELCRMARLGRLDDAEVAWLALPALLDVARELLGEDVRFWWDQGINKAPGSGSLIDWHQDNGYTNGRTAPFLTFWLALDDSSIENGGLHAPG